MPSNNCGSWLREIESLSQPAKSECVGAGIATQALFFIKHKYLKNLRRDAHGSRPRCRVFQSLRSAFTSPLCEVPRPLGQPAGWGSHSHFTDGESKPRSKRLSHVRFNILKVMGTSWVTENRILSRKIDGGWRSASSLAVRALGFLLNYLLVPFS